MFVCTAIGSRKTQLQEALNTLWSISAASPRVAQCTAYQPYLVALIGKLEAWEESLKLNLKLGHMWGPHSFMAPKLFWPLQSSFLVSSRVLSTGMLNVLESVSSTPLKLSPPQWRSSVISCLQKFTTWLVFLLESSYSTNTPQDMTLNLTRLL